MKKSLVTTLSLFALAISYTTAFAGSINFSGYEWGVRAGGGGPGPNNWSDQNVFVDSNGHLHLKITYENGQWNAAELYSNQLFGFGTYQFHLLGRPDLLDDNVVFGLFNYPPPSVGPDGTNEIDIEFATWGGAQSSHGNWAVWPAVAGVGNTSHSYDASLGGDSSTQRFTWNSQQIHYQALAGLTDTDVGEFESWTFSPSDYLQRIPQDPMPFHMNLWLFEGKPPTDGQQVEVVVADFKFTPGVSVNIPEPGCVALLATGLFGLMVTRWRSKTSRG